MAHTEIHRGEWIKVNEKLCKSSGRLLGFGKQSGGFLIRATAGVLFSTGNTGHRRPLGFDDRLFPPERDKIGIGQKAWQGFFSRIFSPCDSSQKSPPLIGRRLFDFDSLFVPAWFVASNELAPHYLAVQDR